MANGRKILPPNRPSTWVGALFALFYALLCGFGGVYAMMGMLTLMGVGTLPATIVGLFAGAASAYVNFEGMLTCLPYIFEKCRHFFRGFFLKQARFTDDKHQEHYVYHMDNGALTLTSGPKRTFIILFSLVFATAAALMWTALFISIIPPVFKTMGMGAIASHPINIGLFAVVSFVGNWGISINSFSNYITRVDFFAKTRDTLSHFGGALMGKQGRTEALRAWFKVALGALCMFGVVMTMLSGAHALNHFVKLPTSAISFLPHMPGTVTFFTTVATIGYAAFTLIAVNRLADTLISLGSKTSGLIAGLYDWQKGYVGSVAAVLTTLITAVPYCLFHAGVYIKNYPLKALVVGIKTINATNAGLLAPKSMLEQHGSLSELSPHTQTELGAGIVGAFFNSAAYANNSGDSNDAREAEFHYLEYEAKSTKHLLRYSAHGKRPETEHSDCNTRDEWERPAFSKKGIEFTLA